MKTKRGSGGKDDDEDRSEIEDGVFSSLTDFINNLGDLAQAGERFSRTRSPRRDQGDPGGAARKATGGESRFSSIIGGLTDQAERRGDISGKRETISKNGEFTFSTKEGGAKGVYGFRLRTGLGGKEDAIKVEPFGNIRKDQKTGAAVVQEIHEPLVDVFEDTNATTLIAEMPGVGPSDIRIEVRDDVLTVSAEKGEKKYRKEILLSHAPIKEKITVTCNNGIVTIRCEKAS
jgi:HSP20 family protein